MARMRDLHGVETRGIFILLWILNFSIRKVKEIDLDSPKVSLEWVSRLWYFWGAYEGIQ